MAYDLTYYRAAVKRRLGVPDDDAWHGQLDLDPDINEALRKLSGEADWPWLEATEDQALTTGTGEISLPTTHRRTINVRIVGKDEPLEFHDIGWLERLSDASGTPRFYGFFGQKLILRPLPSGSMTLRHRFKAREPLLSVGGNTPLLVDDYGGALVEGAAALAARRTSNLDLAKSAQDAYERWVLNMKGETGLDSPSEGGGISPPALPK